MAKIKRIIVRVNGNEMVYYKVDDSNEKLSSPAEVLKKLYKNHGELYEKIFNIDQETALLAGWHPSDFDFNDNCEGWRKFLEAKGKVHKEVIEEEFTIDEFVHSYVGF
jgi:hypothetical protein